MQALIIEHHPAEAAAFAAHLQAEGWTAYVVYSLAQGLASLSAARPDVVLLDMALPDAAGDEALTRILALFPGLAVVAVTDHGDAHLADAAIRRGAQDCLVRREVSPAQLARAMRHAYGRVRARPRVADGGAEEALRESESRFRQLAENIREVFYLTDIREMRLLYVSPAYELIWGRTCASLYADLFSFVEAVHPDDQPQALAALDVQARGEATVTEYRVVRPDGAVRWIRDRAFPIMDADGRLARVSGIAEDITVSKAVELALRESEACARQLSAELEERVAQRTAELQLANRRLELATHAGGVGIWDWDIRRNVLAWDARLHGLYGIEPSAAVTTDSWLQAIHLDDVERAREELEAALRGERPYTSEFRIVRPDGSVCHIQSAGTVIWSAGMLPERMIGVNWDISQHKLAEENLRQSEESLRRANAELSRAMRLKDEFMASVSHELRTPLSAILTICETLEEGIYGAMPGSQLQRVRRISESGHHLLNLINDILDLSKMEARKLDIELVPVGIDEICQSSLLLVREQAAKKQIAVALRIGRDLPSVLADPRRLTQILVNLLSNAVKFTPEGGSIGLDVQAGADGGSVEFSVWDTGIGITPEQAGQLFQPFVQLDSTLARKYNGTGLGLVLVQRLVELHGGSVDLQSEVGVGSRFTVRLWRHAPALPRPALSAPAATPAAGPSAAQAELPAHHPAAAPSARILLAEDNAANMQTLQDYLQAQGYHVIPAMDGWQAVTQAQDSLPDLILMDIQMPDMDGLEAIERIRAMPSLSQTPIIALTALAMPGDRERCLRAGASGYLTKPVSLRRLTDAVEVLLTGVGDELDEVFDL